MKNIFLVRHGESMSNIDPTLYQTVADHAVPLSPTGVEQAHQAGAALKNLMHASWGLALTQNTKLRVWSSPYARTRQTAKAIVSELADSIRYLDYREHINLCEQQFGLFDGVPDTELPKQFPLEHAHYRKCEEHEGRFWARMPLGESRFDVAVRIQQAFGTFHRDAEKHGVDNIVVVCHGGSLRAFAMQWLHLPYEWFDQQPNPGNCDILHISDRRPPVWVYQNSKSVAPITGWMQGPLNPKID